MALIIVSIILITYFVRRRKRKREKKEKKDKDDRLQSFAEMNMLRVR